MRGVLLFLLVIVTHGLQLDNNPDGKSTVANPTKGIIDLEDEESIPASNEKSMIEQNNMNAPKKLTNLQSNDQDPSKHNKKLGKIIEKHEQMGEELRSLKKDFETSKDDSSEGWNNIETFFEGQQGEGRALKLVEFLSMLRQD